MDKLGESIDKLNDTLKSLTGAITNMSARIDSLESKLNTLKLEDKDIRIILRGCSHRGTGYTGQINVFPKRTLKYCSSDEYS